MSGGKKKKGDEESQKKLENVSRWEDVKVVIAMVLLAAIAIVVVVLKYLVMYTEVQYLPILCSNFVNSLILMFQLSNPWSSKKDPR